MSTPVTPVTPRAQYYEFRLLEFSAYNEVVHKDDSDSESAGEEATDTARTEKKDEQQFMVQMFGLDDSGRTYSAFVEGFQPFFYVKVGDHWTSKLKSAFLLWLRDRVGKYYAESIIDCELIKKHKLYWFDAGKLHNFVRIQFANTQAMNKVKNLFYSTALRVKFDPMAASFSSSGADDDEDADADGSESEEESATSSAAATTTTASANTTGGSKMRTRTIVCSNIRYLPGGDRIECTLTHTGAKMTIKTENIIDRKQVLREEGLEFKIKDPRTGRMMVEYLPLYEANIPPILRFFHIQNISPSGWVRIEKSKTDSHYEPLTTCDVEFTVNSQHVKPIEGDERKVPLKICSFDIEASSSHGDFPIPVKSYEKLATDIINYWDKDAQELTNRGGKPFAEWGREEQEILIMTLVNAAFVHMTGDGKSHPAIAPIYTKRQIAEKDIPKLRENIQRVVQSPIRALKHDDATVRLVNSITSMFTKATGMRGLGDVDAEADGFNPARNAGGDGDADDTSTVVSGADGAGDGDGDGDEDDDDNGQNAEEEEDTAGDGEDDNDEPLSKMGIPIKSASASFSAHPQSVPHWMRVKTYVKVRSTIVDLLNDRKFDRQQKLNEITLVLQTFLPPVKGDTVTFIGSTFLRFGEQDTYKNHCIVLNDCDKIASAEVETYNTEREVLLAWTRLIQRENPDIIIGYNIFGFDYRFMYYRARENNCLEEFLKLSRNRGQVCGKFNEKLRTYEIEQSSITIASGTYNLEFIKIPGRLQVDMLNYFRREFQFSSYKLDAVASTVIGDKVKTIAADRETGKTIVKTKNLAGLRVGNYVCFEEIAHSSDMYMDGAKFPVTAIDTKTATFTIDGIAEPDTKKIIRWCMTKDDIDHHDIFNLSKGSSADRAIVAKYCIQDCNLVHYLMNKVDVVTGYIEMANLCSVPIDFLVMRGQGIKLQSFLAKQCAKRDTLMPVLEKKRDGGYEGAIVLPPKCDLYLDEPVACNDYSSLYPSSMISENLSHDSKVWTKEFDLAGNQIRFAGDESYDNLPEYEYVDVTHDTYDWFPNARGKLIKTLVGRKTCRFAQYPDGRKGIIPEILVELLAARKSTRKSIEFKTVVCSDGRAVSGAFADPADGSNLVFVTEKNGTKHKISRDEIISIEDTYNDFMKNILDKRQLAYKVTANSMYGQCGARTSAFYDKDVAASTTAVGRMALTYGRRIIEEVYGDAVCETKYGKVRTHATYIYGDTDSVFYSLKLTDLDGRPIVGKEALCHTIELGMEIGKLASKFLKPPHDWVYEKTFMPFILLSKKRYVGMLFEDDPEEKPYRKSMGIVLKRRDNAPIVKDVYGGAIDILMSGGSIQEAVTFTQKCLMDVVGEKYPLEKLIITKSLRGFYKKPESIAHKALADRIGKRDPGNKPSVGDRIPFVYIETKGKVKLQGDKVEHPDYIRKQGLRPDYGFYITNQIMKPLQQLFALVLERIPTYRHKIGTLHRQIEELRRTIEDDVKFADKEKKLRNDEVKKLVFDAALRKSQNLKNKQTSVDGFFKASK
jgi:DNA polymerase elongation subunit (family B)